MTAWTPDTEEKIRKLGDYVETQMKDLLDPDASALGSLSRIFARATKTGFPAMKSACRAAGFEFSGSWLDDLKNLVQLAGENNSTSADKIKKAIPVAEKIMVDFKGKDGSELSKIKAVKKMNIRY